MITKEILYTFCDGARITESWTRGNRSYATNGRIIVRTDTPIAGVAENDRAPNADSLEWHLFSSVESFAPLPDIPVSAIRECEDCHGTGLQSCRNCTCEECGGVGEVQDVVPVAVGTRRFANLVLRKLAILPHLVIAQDGGANNPCPFKFEGGDGLIMPLRQGQ